MWGVVSTIFGCETTEPVSSDPESQSEECGPAQRVGNRAISLCSVYTKATIATTAR